MFRLRPGDIACTPSNVVVLQQAVADSVFLCWAFLDAACMPQLKTSLSCCLSVASSYPSVAKDAFATWTALLQGGAAGA